MEKKKITIRHKVAWAALVGSVFIFLLMIIYPVFSIFSGDKIFFWPELYIGVALIVVFIVLMRNISAWEIITGVNVVLFVAGCFPFPVNWWIWIPQIILSIIYLKNYEKTNQNKGVVVTFMILAILGLIFIAQYVIRNGRMWYFG